MRLWSHHDLGRFDGACHDALASWDFESLPLDLAHGATDTESGEPGTANERVGGGLSDSDSEYEERPLTLASSTRA